MAVPPLDNPAIGGVDVGTSSTEVRAANTERRYLLLVNDSDTEIYVALGTDAVLNEGIRLNSAGGWYEMLEGQNLYTGVVNAIASAATKRLTFQEA
jgi:hypothetical protein